MSKTKKIILTAIFLTTHIILSRFFSIKTPILKISFAFIPTMLCATWLGPKWTLLLNVLADIIGSILFPTGPYFVGYTISTAIAALIYGFLLYQKTPVKFSNKAFILKTIIAVTFVAVISNMFLNTLWTVITTGKAFQALFVTRITKQILMIPIQIIVFLFIERILRKPFNEMIRSSND